MANMQVGLLSEAETETRLKFECLRYNMLAISEQVVAAPVLYLSGPCRFY